MGWFGTNKNEVWRQVCAEIGAEFVDGGAWKGNKVQLHSGNWMITLDVHTVSTGESQETYTRVRVPYVNPDGFRFTIYRKGVFSTLGKLCGMQDIEVNDPFFDDAFIIKGNNESRVQSLFADAPLRALIQAQPAIRLEVKDSEGWFGPSFPENVDELHFQVRGVIKDADRLKSLFDLFSATLEQLCRLGSADRQGPSVAL